MYAQPFSGQGMSSSGAQSLAVRNLELLRAIEDTVDGLVADTDLVTSISRTYSELKSKLLPNTTEIDPSGRICAVLDKASNSCVRIYNDAKNRHVSARLDPQVRPDDGLVEAYNEFVSAVNELHDTIEDTGTKENEIADRFGNTVLNIVKEVTDDKEKPKHERKILQIEHAPTLSNEAKLVKLADKISNIDDVINNPPPDWSNERRHEYLDWAEQVVNGLRGINKPLENRFDELLKLGKAIIPIT